MSSSPASPNPHLPAKRVAIVGGGITGLTAAYHLRQIAPNWDVQLIEAADRTGGVLRTEPCDGFLVEHSADNFITNVPEGIGLCRELGLADDLMETDSTRRRAFIVRRGRLLPVPEGFMLMSPKRIWPLVTTPLLSPWGKLRLLAEYFVPAQQPGVVDDESLADFAERRLGREAFRWLVQPLVGGIYTADSRQLSLAATLPRFLEMERQYGGLIRAAQAERRRTAQNNQAKESSGSGARYSMFMAPRRGMQQLPDALASKLPPESIQLDSPVAGLTPDDSGWSLTINDNPQHFDAVLLTSRTYQAAQLVESFDNALAAKLREITYASSAVVVFGYERKNIAHPLDGFGFVVPEAEGRPILAGSFTSRKFRGRAPADCELIRVFLGGAARPDLAEAPEEELIRIARGQLEELLGVSGAPRLCKVVRWREAMPQYHLGHQKRVAEIRAQTAKHPGLLLAGNAYDGVGIPNCIRSAKDAAAEMVSLFAEQPAS